ncbi:LDB7-like protein [Lachancea thermotolerans]|uniref:KLTH0E07810p n=1 Tax=Lachancea thermotolerans (strain ATCC 56472 / CBS 6340 / NRRL Y-8284) TaxID=559295 RepID=C5DHX1_LACTC|nr:KLTH0E07810p [Lachancea thermotolerans CBS 6340]CAR23382.1 KLTH0E07810p [Lachancea thermotolerans CBS 6340]
MAQYDLGYYDTISGLSALECSHKVTLSQGQLLELCTKDSNAREDRDNTKGTTEEKDRKDKRRTPVHGYLSKTDPNITLSSTYELNHTLLGGHVPRATLEALSSTDFAQYFQKVIDFEKALQTHNYFAAQNVNTVPTVPSSPASSLTPSTPVPASQVENTRRPRSQQSDGVKKVILCKLCKARFSGPRRFTNMKKHMCMRA